jgi:hypothetical protein
MTIDELNALRTRLHHYGLANWVGRSTTTPNDMLRIAQTCVDALDQFDRYETEIYRLDTERSEWSGIAAQRNRTNALLADDRDTERTKRLQAEHERDSAVKKLAELCSVEDTRITQDAIDKFRDAARSALDVPQAPSDGWLVKCENCTAEVVLPYLTAAKTAVDLRPCNGWELHPRHLCPTCQPHTACLHHMSHLLTTDDPLKWLCKGCGAVLDARSSVTRPADSTNKGE